jgi:molecular chaperone DnaK
VVRIDARGNVTVGARARRFLDTDPDNTRSEFKRLMGSGRQLAFRAAKVEKSPEELSALVLQTLRAQAEQTLGHAPVAAVIAVPALFELPQIRATSEAARLAGFTRVEHLQEPVASALTAGWKSGDDSAPWLVYDLGGGTFDVSLLETREGVLRVVDHDGDNFLGGRDMDARLLDTVLASLEETCGKPFRRSDATLAPLFRRLRSACEDAKFELGSGRDAVVSLAEPIVVAGEEVLVDVAIPRATFESLVTPIVDRSIEICLRLLERQGMTPNGIARVVLVGGPTVMPVLRTRLVERLGIALATDVDPMTAVAEGAALFAREHDLVTDARAGAKKHTGPAAGEAAPTAERVWLQFPSVSGDLFPYVVGRVAAGRVDRVWLERANGSWKSCEESVDEDGSFVVQAELLARSETTFRVVAAKAGQLVILEASEVKIRHGLSLGDPPLSRTIGVALADGGVLTYFERGAPLPSRKTFRLRTALTVHPGQTSSAITVPIVQGEIDIAHLCRVVGQIEIKPQSLTTVLPAGSPVDIVIEIDRGGSISAIANLPDQGVSFPGTLALVSPDEPVDALDAKLTKLRERVEALYVDPYLDAAGKTRLVALDGQLDDALRELEAARGADADALEKLRRMLIDVDGGLAEVEALKAWPELEQHGLEQVTFAIHWIGRTGTEVERRTLDEAIRSLERARAMRSTSEFGKRLSSVKRLGETACMRDPDVVLRTFQDAAGRIGEMRDPRAAQALIAKGQSALARGETDAARQATYALWELLPPKEEVRVKAHGSGIER